MARLLLKLLDINLGSLSTVKRSKGDAKADLKVLKVSDWKTLTRNKRNARGKNLKSLLK